MTAEESSPPKVKTWVNTVIWVGPLVVLLLLTALGALREDNVGVPIEVRDHGELIATVQGDFPSHFRFARAVLDGSLDRGFTETNRSVYTPDSHRLMMEEWTGKEARLALPFAYSPTCVWLMAPLMPLPPVWAFAVWTALGISVSLWAVARGSVPPLVAALVFLSPLNVWLLRYGQTALLSFGGLAYLYFSLRTNRERKGSEDSGRLRSRLAYLSVLLSQGVVLWALTAKPPLAIVAGVALVAQRHYRPVLLAVLLTAVSTLALTPWLGPNWVGDYLQMLRSYNAEQADPTFAWCLRPTYQSSLRAVLYLNAAMTDAKASQIATLLWGLSLLGVLFGGWRGWSGSVVWSLSVLGYLLLGPHVNSSEDINLLLLAAVGVSIVPGSSFLSAFLVALTINLSPGNSITSTWVFPPLVEVTAKAALAVAILWANRGLGAASRIQ